MLAWSEGPWAGHADSYAERITREDFDISAGSALANVANKKANEAEGALKRPDGHNAVQHELLGTRLEMDPYGAKSDSRTCNVAVQKDLIEGVADWRWGLDQEKYECASALSSMLDIAPSLQGLNLQ